LRYIQKVWKEGAGGVSSIAARRWTSAAIRVRKIDSITAIIGKHLQVAESTCRRLNAPDLLPTV
jgi:hypothetical protein